MAQAVNVNFKLDADVKKSMEQACSELGLSMSAAFTVFAKKVGREKRIPFDVAVDPFYSESNIRYLEQKMADYKAGKTKFAEHERIPEEKSSDSNVCFEQNATSKSNRQKVKGEKIA